MSRVAKGCVEQLPSGSWRARVYAGVDPITKREIRLKATAKTEQQAHIELGRLLKEASEGRTPESDATVARLLDEYAAIAPWDVSTRQSSSAGGSLITAVASSRRRLGRGTSRGTAGRRIPVQSGLQVRSAVSSVQVMQSVRGSMPLVMRRWLGFSPAAMFPSQPGTGTSRRRQSSLGYEHYDARRYRLGPSPVFALASAYGR